MQNVHNLLIFSNVMGGGKTPSVLSFIIPTRSIRAKGRALSDGGNFFCAMALLCVIDQTRTNK